MRPPTWGDLLDHTHAAFAAGYDLGYAKGQRAVSVDLARRWLADLGNHWADTAYQTAAANRGPEWAKAIAEQGEVS